MKRNGFNSWAIPEGYTGFGQELDYESMYLSILAKSDAL